MHDSITEINKTICLHIILFYYIRSEIRYRTDRLSSSECFGKYKLEYAYRYMIIFNNNQFNCHFKSMS